MDDVKQKFERLSLRWKVAIVALGVVLAAPFAYAAFMGTLALVSGIIALAIVSASIAFAPVWAMKLANWRLKAVMAEATANPIPTKWNIYRERVEALKANAEKIQRFQAMIGQKEGEVERLEKAFPAEGPPFRKFIEAMKALLEQRKREFKVAQRAVENYRVETEKAEMVWNLAVSARELQVASGKTALDPLKAIADKTAMASVELAMNDAFAQLDRVMLERVDEPAALAAPADSATSGLKINERVSH